MLILLTLSKIAQKMLNPRMLDLTRSCPEMYFLPSYITCLKACLHALHRQEGNPEYTLSEETF